jgi:menaquinone-specific isochorismate synthase
VTGPELPALTVETVPCDDLGSLAELLDERDPLLWTRHGFGIGGIGTAVRLEFRGPDRVRDAAAAWRELAGRASITDPLRFAGTGLIAFGSFTFSGDSGISSVLIVPSIVIGRSAGRRWITRIGVGGVGALELPPSRPLGTPYGVTLEPGEMSADAYVAAVETAVTGIRDHRLGKVVLARDLVGRMPDGADLRLVAKALAVGYPDCWTFAIDGFIGSSPETLVRVSDGTVSARVLAGSAARGADAESDEESAVALAVSSKDLDEHGFAVRSVLASLRPHSATVSASELPFTLKLPNLWHLASDVEGLLTDGSTALDLVSALHPTAAVAGSPTDRALEMIAELEPFDRGRYAGPVGWIDAQGDGEWAVAVRSAQVMPDGRVSAYAGAGIVADSVPERELVETRLKFRPMVEAFR